MNYLTDRLSLIFISLLLITVSINETLATIIHTIDQPVTSTARCWTHPVSQAGDYQIGMAWIEVLSGGDVAVEIFINRTSRVKALYAAVGEVTRFETRLEGLIVGDEIIVAITPNGSTYRAGYKIALGTPTFDGLPIFDVANYGAVGDGATDDFAAIQLAVTAAKNGGGGIVRFDGSKTYRTVGLGTLAVETLIDLNTVNNIKIEGNGATVTLHPPDRFADIQYAENIEIDGFTIDYDTKPYYQGTITDINVANMTIDITVPERYPEPMTGVVSLPGSSVNGRGPVFGRSFIPDSPSARSGHGDNIYIASTATNGSARQIQIQVPATVNGVSMVDRVQYAYDNNATEFVVPHYLYGHRNGTTKIYSSSRIKLSNLHFTVMCHFWLTITQNHGPITLSNVDLKTPNPETELLVSWRDGMHIKNGRWGIMIEEGDWDGAAMYDDTFALYSRRQVVVSTNSNVVTLTPSYGGRETFLWQAGDWASFWSSDQSIFRGMARVISATDVANPNFAVTCESIPAGVTANDIVLHEESLNRNTVIRNSRTTNVGTEDSSTRFRGTDVLLQNNHFEDFGLRFEWSDGLGTPRARDVVIEACYIGTTDGAVTVSRSLGVLFKNCTINNTEVICNSGAENIYFDNVAWTGSSGDILDLKSASTAWLFGDSSRNGSTSGLSGYVAKDGGSMITYAPPSGYPEGVPSLKLLGRHFIVHPDADAYVMGGGSANMNFGGEGVLKCKTDLETSLYNRRSYLRFDLSSIAGTIDSAILRIKVAATNGSGDMHTAYYVSDDSWGESTIIWNNKPAETTMIDTALHPDAGGWLELDVTHQVASEQAGDQVFSTVLISNGIVLVDYHSKEAASGNYPELVIQTASGDLTFDAKVDMADVAELGRLWQNGYDINTLEDVTEDWLLSTIE